MIRQTTLANRCRPTSRVLMEVWPRIVQSSWAVFKPTKRMTNSPTNLTEKVETRKTPVRVKYSHHSLENDAESGSERNLTSARIAADMKNISKGSSRMNLLRTAKPVSNRRKLEDKVEAARLSVRVQMVRNATGMMRHPTRVQPTLIPITL